MQLVNLTILMNLAPAIMLWAQSPADLPATQLAAADPSRFLVSILPVQVAGKGMLQWIGRSVQQSLQAEVSASGYVLYDQRPIDGRYRPVEHYPPAPIGYLGVYPYDFNGPGYTIIRRYPQYFPQIGFGLGFGNGNNHLQLNVPGGVGQNSTTGSSTTIIGGP